MKLCLHFTGKSVPHFANSTAESQTQWTLALLASVIKIKVIRSQLWLLKLKPEDKIWCFAKHEGPATLTVASGACCCLHYCQNPGTTWPSWGEKLPVFGLQETSSTDRVTLFHGTQIHRSATDRRDTPGSPSQALTLCTFLMSLVISRVRSRAGGWSQSATLKAARNNRGPERQEQEKWSKSRQREKKRKKKGSGATEWRAAAFEMPLGSLVLPAESKT